MQSKRIVERNTLTGNQHHREEDIYNELKNTNLWRKLRQYWGQGKYPNRILNQTFQQIYDIDPYQAVENKI